LRALDPADTATPAYDLTAVYLRQQDGALQIRVDVLDFSNPNELSIDIQIDNATVPGEKPYNIHVPSESLPARISLDPLLATATVTIPFSEIPADPRVDVSTPEDEIIGLTLDSPVPAQTAPLLLTFYDTFAGRFPAEALRSWDGAHTGPRGERHGLKHLLDAAEEYQIPVVLLDLKEPENLSASDAMGVLPRIKNLAGQGLLILPENGKLLEAASPPPGPAARAQEFGFPKSPFSYNLSTSGFQFVFLEDRTHLYRPLFSSITYFPTAAEVESTLPTPNGPSLEVRRALLDTALNTNDKDLLVLGGNFQNTTWGSPDMVGPTLAYFASRPYIHILSADDLTNFPTRTGKPEILPSHLDSAVDTLESNYESLTRPVLAFAAKWQGSPLASCATDLDKDNQPECVLADEGYLAILDPQGARLTYLFTREGESLHQLIGPSWQVAVGLSNPSTWNLSADEAADPGAYPGAFADVDDPFKVYEPSFEGNTLTFTSLDGTRIKSFKVTEAGIEVEYQTPEPVTTQIPLLVDPDTRFTPGWAENYVQQNTPYGVAWGLENGPMVGIKTEGKIMMQAFTKSLSLLSTPEDPDFDYPPGHYVPFPMAVTEVEVQDGYFLWLERLP